MGLLNSHHANESRTVNTEHQELVLFRYPATAAVWERDAADLQHQFRIDTGFMLDQKNLDSDAVLKTDFVRTYFTNV